MSPNKRTGRMLMHDGKLILCRGDSKRKDIKMLGRENTADSPFSKRVPFRSSGRRQDKGR